MADPDAAALLGALARATEALRTSTTEHRAVTLALQHAVDAGLTAAGVARGTTVRLWAGSRPALDPIGGAPSGARAEVAMGRRRLVVAGRDLGTPPWVQFVQLLAALIGQALDAEDRIERAEQEHRFLVEGFPHAVAIVRRSVIRYANQRWSEALGCHPDPLAWVHPEDRQRAREHVEACSGLALEVRIAGDPGRWFEIFATSDRRLAGRRAAMLVARDVTDRRALQETVMVYDRMATTGLLSAGVAHEINNPLTAVVANLEGAIGLVRGHLGQAEAHGWLHELIAGLQDARTGADRLHRVVQDLRMFSSGAEAEDELVDVRSIMDSSLKMAASALNVRARIETRFEDVPLVYASPSRIGQVFLNLLTNAAKALPVVHPDRNRIWIHIHAADDKVWIEVGDNGGGIAPEVRDRIFDPFVTTRDLGEGTGLGLAICHRIVSRLGGTIEARDPAEGGAVFVVGLPRAPPDHPVPPPVAPRPPAGGSRILVIDDDMLLGRAIQRMLAGHEVVVYTHGRTALDDLAHDTDWNLILLDLMMPGMSGLDVFEELLLDYPQLVDRVVLITAAVYTESARRLLGSRHVPTLEKPFDGDALRSLL